MIAARVNGYGMVLAMLAACASPARADVPDTIMPAYAEARIPVGWTIRAIDCALAPRSDGSVVARLLYPGRGVHDIARAVVVYCMPAGSCATPYDCTCSTRPPLYLRNGELGVWCSDATHGRTDVTVVMPGAL
jgi:hypothetical protein